MGHFDKKFSNLSKGLNTTAKASLFIAGIQPELAPEMLAIAGGAKTGSKISGDISKLLKKKKKPKK